MKYTIRKYERQVSRKITERAAYLKEVTHTSDTTGDVRLTFVLDEEPDERVLSITFQDFDRGPRLQQLIDYLIRLQK